MAKFFKFTKCFTLTYAKISRDPHMKNNLKKYIRRKNEDNQPYNEPFTERELKVALKQQKNTAPREDIIYPRMIKKLPPETLKYLLDLYK